MEGFRGSAVSSSFPFLDCDVNYCRVEFGAILCYFYICDRTSILGESTKVIRSISAVELFHSRKFMFASYMFKVVPDLLFIFIFFISVSDTIMYFLSS